MAAIMAPGAFMGLMEEEWQHSMGAAGGTTSAAACLVEIPGYVVDDTSESWEHLLNQSQQQPQQQQFAAAAPMLEAVEGISEGIITTTAGSSSPVRSRHGDADPVTSSRKRKKDRAADDPKQRERAGGKVRKAKDRNCSSENSGDSGSGGKLVPQQQEQYSKQDYIHVRARRGQATDSHSLAERVRREKMSERMKFLQDLVPGCRKVTGKAVMLDEIINYVQSLQRQVESLSMKLASVSPAQQQQSTTTSSTHWTLESLMSNKEIQFSSNNNNTSNNNNLLATSFGMMQQQQQQQQQAPPSAVLVQQQQQQQAGLLSNPFGFGNNNVIRNTSTAATAPPIAAASLADLCSFDTNIPQFTGRDGELQCVVQHMGLHNRSFAGQFHCQLPVGHMKVEF